MNALDILGPALTWLWRSSWQASVLVVLVLLVHRLFRARLTAYWRHALWWLVLIRLLLPALPATPFSIFNLARFESLSEEGTTLASRLAAPYRREPPSQPLPRDQEPGAAGSAPTADVPASQPLLSQASPPTALSSTHGAFSTSDYVFYGSVGIWLIGVGFLGTRLVIGNYGFARGLRRCRPASHPVLLAVLEECRRLVGVQVGTVIETPEVDSPALFGCFRVKLLLPPGMAERFSEKELRHIFLHELSHVRRGDVPVNWLMTVVQIAHWFNPVIWFAFSRIRADREAACDGLALSLVKEQESQPYGLQNS